MLYTLNKNVTIANIQENNPDLTAYALAWMLLFIFILYARTQNVSLP